MKQIQIYSPVKGPTGYEIVARDLIEELDKKNVHVCLEEFKNWGPFEVTLRKEHHSILGKALENKPFRQPGAITNLNICLPEQVKLQDHMRNVNLTMFEADNIPQNWLDFIRLTDELIVPTDFNQWSFTHSNNIPKEKIKVLPIGYNPDRYNEQVEPLALQAGDKSVLDFPIRFLVVCEITERKNFYGTLQLFYLVAERIGVDKCCLLLKVGNYSRNIDLVAKIKEFKDSIIKDGAIRDLPYNVFNYPAILPEEAHPNFIATGTHYLSTSFGEGWDLTAMQAAACGLHVFVPMHSAYQCWLNSDTCTFLPVAKKMRASQAPPTGRLYVNSNWYAYHMVDSVEIITANMLDSSVINQKKSKMREYVKNFAWKNWIEDYILALHL